MAETRFFCIGESGSADSKIVVYGWVELLARDWEPALRTWAAWRKALHGSTGVPVDYELRATDFANGRGNPTKTAWDRDKSARTAVVADALATIGTMPDVRTGAVHRRAESRCSAARAAVYAELVREIDQRLRSAGEFGIVLMNGNGAAPLHRAAHRALDLASRRIVEDPLCSKGSRADQWDQVADLVAYAAYQHVLRAPGKEAAWEWYPNLLGGASATGRVPEEL
ncbi:hypothetical protein [Actinosynnema pretiosum]|uniref:DUF3800 domain-containing protein n=1 Tax=Actinosynnema pretiosum TaxID=42197 RepID=A0A290YYY4_9PSEU|nr:hypothetical protein [Actinosynnema pretiosum]ATE51967.1 hypothetical protein CNX65_00580 [Actinosynnema pretiosum]